MLLAADRRSCTDIVHDRPARNRVCIRSLRHLDAPIYRYAGELLRLWRQACAKIVAVKDERRKSKIGTVIIPGATKSADNQWKGDLLNADDGKIYTGVVTMQGPNALNLKGCVAFICQGETWTKIK